MEVITNHPLLREVALKVVSDPGFSLEEHRIGHTLQRWFTAIEPQRRAVDSALHADYLRGIRAEYERGMQRAQSAVSAFVLPGASTVILGETVDDDPDDDADTAPGAPAAVIRFVSESPDYSRGAAESAPPKQAAKAAPKRGSTPHFGPVTVTERQNTATTAAPEPAPAAAQEHAQPKPNAPVQQTSWKVAGYQRKQFDALYYPVQLPGGPKPEGDLNRTEVDYRLAQIGKQNNKFRDEITRFRARIRDRETLNTQDQREITERNGRIRDSGDEHSRLTAARARLKDDTATISDLPDDELAACGYRKRVE